MYFTNNNYRGVNANNMILALTFYTIGTSDPALYEKIITIIRSKTSIFHVI